jgi:alkylation response protein AidB-like acyl-CoA dehydrogenase
MIRDIARKVAEEKIIPVRADLDEKEEFPWEIIREIAKADLCRVNIPEEYGGLGEGVLDLCLAMEELSRGCPGVAISYGASSLGTLGLLRYGSEEQKRKYLPRAANGEGIAAFALTESSAGSDIMAIKTSAVLDGDSYVINGTKQFITNGGEADLYAVVVVTNLSRGARGTSTILVEKDTPGFTFGKKEKKMGIRCSATRELVFHNCRVSAANLVGKEGTGLIVALKTFEESRPVVAAQAVGLAQAALEEATSYALNREQFGTSISNFQAIQHMLVNMAMELEAARALVYAAARTIDSGAKNIGEVSSMSKVFASDMAMRVTTDAVQILGGPGYMRDYPMEKMMRDAKIIQIYEGTNQVLRNDMASHLFKRKGKRAQR